jgi:hypothetical protein
MKQNERVTGKEQYYTPVSTADQLVAKMLDFADSQAHWLEPAGGTGVFLEAMQRAGIQSITSYDIEPLHPEVAHTDNFLLENLNHLQDCVTLTNPPFGRANKLSIPFFNKCAAVSSVIGFLVPKSWRKWSAINRLDKNFHLIYDEDLTVDFICADGRPRSQGKLATIFQVWEKRPQERIKIVIEDRGYIKKTTPEKADASLTVFGRGCGNIKTIFDRRPNTTQMFLKLLRPWALDALQSVKYERFCKNVAFIEALSIQEINFLLNEYADSRGLS